MFIFLETRDLKSDLLKIHHKQSEVETDILRLKTNVTGIIYNKCGQCSYGRMNLNFLVIRLNRFSVFNDILRNTVIIL